MGTSPPFATEHFRVLDFVFSEFCNRLLDSFGCIIHDFQVYCKGRGNFLPGSTAGGIRVAGIMQYGKQSVPNP